MKKLLVFLCLLGLAAPALAGTPQMTVGPPGGPVQPVSRDQTCQYGFQDDYVGSGYTLGLGQALGISCGPGMITGVGAYCEFLATPGTCNVDIFDNGTLVQTTPVTPVAGNNEWDVPDVNIAGTACIMLDPVDPFWAVTGEDATHAPFANTYWGPYLTPCLNMFTNINLTIWAHYGNPVPVQNMSWGQVRMTYR